MEEEMSYPGIFIFLHEFINSNDDNPMDWWMPMSEMIDPSSSITVILNSINDIMIDWWFSSLRMKKFWYFSWFLSILSKEIPCIEVRITRSWCRIRIFLLSFNDDRMNGRLEMSYNIKYRFSCLILDVLHSNFLKVLLKAFLDLMLP